MVEPIRLKLTPRVPQDEFGDIRHQFWRSIRQDAESSADFAKLEGKICRDLARELRYGLIDEIAAPLRKIERSAFRDEFGSLEHFMFRAFERKDGDYGRDTPQIFDTLVRHFDARQRLFQENPEIRRIQDKVARAGGIYFSAKIAGYSSLNLDISVSGIAALADVFDRDFDSFRVFLEAFIPHAVGRVFWEETADLLEYSTQIPPSFEASFKAATAQPLPAYAPANPATVAALPATPREKAEWLWKLANGSLLLPVLLALVVMYFGLSMLNDIRGTQFDALKPVLEHQLKLLEEDRHRLNDSRETPPTERK